MQVGGDLFHIRWQLLALGREAFDVATCTECAACAGNYDGSHGRIFLACQSRIHQVFGHLQVERVQHLRPVKRQVGDSVTHIEEHVGVLHLHTAFLINRLPHWSMPRIGNTRPSVFSPSESWRMLRAVPPVISLCMVYDAGHNVCSA